MKSLTVKDINLVLFKDKERTVRAVAMIDFANVLNEMYSSCSTHKYLLGDCVLAKLNMLRKGKRVRVNKNRIRHVDDPKNPYEISTEGELRAD